MKNFKQTLVLAGVLSFIVALFQAILSFSPSLSLYFGAPVAIVTNIYMLICLGLMVSMLLVVFGLYALSGAGYIRTLPWLKPVLVLICSIYTLRGLGFIPELLVIIGVIHFPEPVDYLQFIVFLMSSLFSLMIGLTYLTGTIGGWDIFPSKKGCLPNKIIEQMPYAEAF